jgi:predicted DNA-binding transcriptional regulator YafY
MYHPTGRVLTVLELLQSRPGLTGPELAARLETDVRTVRRYVSKLQDVGIPVEAQPGRYGGYRLRPGYKLPPLIFSESEATAIVLGLMGSSWLEVDQSPAAVEGALSKITRVLPDAARERVLSMSSVMFLSPHEGDGRPDASLLLMLGDSVQARMCIDLAYRSESEELTRRIVEPCGLVGHRGKWYLVGWCRLRTDFRTFRLDRIQAAAPMQERFVRRADFDFRAYAMAQLDNWPVNWRIRVVFTAPMARVRERIPASLGTLMETPEGVCLEWPTDDLCYAARYLVGRSLPFVVKEPLELRAELHRLADEVSRIADSA